jgi:hypothetical protein
MHVQILHCQATEPFKLLLLADFRGKIGVMRYAMKNRCNLGFKKQDLDIR